MSIVLKPRMSEKTYAQSEKSVFCFDVDAGLNKHQIAQAVQSTYDVTVTQVRIVIRKGRAKRVYKKRSFEHGTTPDIKKAYVTLKAGQSIPIFAAVEEAEEKVEKTEKAVKKAQAKKDKKAGKDK
jgi:large subunit ribosomal protein L23